MPVPGLSLVGFMDQAAAHAHFINQCVCASNAPADLDAEWNAAKAKLGPASPNVGHPDIQPIPAANVAHINQLQNGAWVGHLFAAGGALHGAQFALVEIDPLLAFQFTIGDGRSRHHGATLPWCPSVDMLLPVCLPLAPQTENFHTFNSPNSILLKARSLNVVNFGGGVFNAAFMGIQFGVTLPFVHVVKHNGRHYLHNGFHRALALRRAGATHAPCILRDVPDHASVGIRTDGATFGATLLESANPPTLGHFTQGRAYDVQLKSVARYLHVSWADYVIPDEN
jgi:hypothetical protein